MSDEKAPADDLRSILSASFDETMTSAAALDIGASAKPADGAEPAAKVEPEPKEPKEGERARAPDGKFAKKDGEAEEKPDPAAADKPKDEPKAEAKTDGAEKPVEPKEEPKADGKGAPENWSASDKALFKLQSPDAQAFLLRRHGAMEADYTKKVGAIAELKKEFEPIQQMFAPHLDVLKQKGMTPASTIRAWANVETALANGKGVDVIAGMIKGYNIDKAALGKALGFTSTTAAEPGTDPATTIPAPDGTPGPITLPPELTQELQQLRARLDAQDSERRNAQTSAAQERESKVETDITNFKSASNDKGELLHPYFEEVEPAMIALASSYVASKQPIPPLPELYETAVWANPSTRAAMLASQKAVDQAKLAEEARAKAASARKAGSSVTGAPGSGQSSKQIRGDLALRDELDEAYAAHSS